MTSKHWALVGGAVACLASLFASSFVSASPWVEPGDTYARVKLQQAADRGQLDAVVSTWPLSRSNAKLSRNPDGSTNMALWNDIGGQSGGSAEITVSGSSSPAMVRGFGGAVGSPGEVDFTFEFMGNSLALGISPSYAVDPTDDEKVRYDGSYLATTFSNWTAGAGYIDRWWGPGWQSSLILSDNARPTPSVWLNRRNTQTSDSPWLSWLGPWQFTGFVGRLESERFVPDANLIGMRFNFRPFQSLEVGLSRIIQWGGEGQPNSASSLVDSLRGKDNFGASGEKQDPGNQLAGVDFRYSLQINASQVGLYTQVVGEDEAGYLPSRKVYQVGVDWTSALFNGEQQWFLEGTDTLTEGLFGGEERPNYAYEHFSYRSGMRHLGRNMATTFDADSRAATLGVYHFSNPETRWYASLTYADFNRDGSSRFRKGTGQDIDYFVPASAQDVVMLDLSHTRPLPVGGATFHLSLASDSVELADDSVDEISGAIEWHIPL